MTTEDALKLLSNLVDAEWRRWDDARGEGEAPRQYDAALAHVREELARGKPAQTVEERIAEVEASLIDIGRRQFRA